MEDLSRVGVRQPVKIWLQVGLVMIFFQVILGGITRLTGSGLSITKWDIVTGAIPPTSAADWEVEYKHYQLTPQYAKVNKDMTLSSFKRIYFWEFFHRLWARSMGFVFIIPLLFFLRKRWIGRRLKKQLWMVFGLAAIVASFGWIMVASGLIDRPWVNAYKLMIHLSLAIFLFEYLLITYLSATAMPVFPFGKNYRLVLLLLILVAFQVMLGGLMSGMKAGFAFPTFPKMSGTWIPAELLDGSQWTWTNMANYDKARFAPALVQLIHRLTAYSIVIGSGLLVVRVYGHKMAQIQRTWVAIFASLVVLQVALGIFTLLGCEYGKVPLTLGVLHQAVGLLTLSSMVVIWFMSRSTHGTAHS